MEKNTGNISPAQRYIFIIIAILFVAIAIIMVGGDTGKLYEGEGVLVREVIIDQDYNLVIDNVDITKSQLIETSDGIVYGQVVAISNILIEDSGFSIFGDKASTKYMSVIDISVKEAYKGGFGIGQIVRVIAQVPIIDYPQPVIGAEVLSQIKKGDVGMFLINRYTDDNSQLITSDYSLDMRNIAPYQFFDGSRFLFIQREDGFIYNKEFYDELYSVDSIWTVKNYIIELMKEYQ